MNPSGNAIAYDINAANSPSFASVQTTWNNGTNSFLQFVANSNKLTGSPPNFGNNICVLNSEKPVNDVINACAWVPLTGILNNFPANTLLVPSKPPRNYILQFKFITINFH